MNIEEETHRNYNGRISSQAIRLESYVPHRLPSRYRRQSWTDRALVPLLMLGLGVTGGTVLFCGGFLFYIGMKTAERILGL